MSNKQKKEGILSKLGLYAKNFGPNVMYHGEIEKTNKDPGYSYRKEERKEKLAAKKLAGEGDPESGRSKEGKLKKPIKRMFTTSSVLKSEGIKPGSRFDAIDEVIDIVEVVPDKLDKFFYGLEYLGQSAVDQACEETGEFVSNKLQDICDNVTSYLHDRYGGAMLLASKLEVVKNPPTSPDAVVTYMSDFIDQHKWAQIVTLIYDFVVQLPPKINRLITALTKIASYRPPQMGIDVSFDKFQLKSPSVSVDKIIG